MLVLWHTQPSKKSTPVDNKTSPKRACLLLILKNVMPAHMAEVP